MLVDTRKSNCTAFISGWGISSNIWQQSHLLLDLPYAKEFTIESIVKQLASAIPNATSIIGWSLGGLLAIKLAFLFPHKVRDLTLICTTPKFTEAPNWPGTDVQIANQFLAFAKRDLQGLSQYFIKLVSYPSRSSEHKKILQRNLIDVCQLPSHWLGYLELLLTADLREDYCLIKQPILNIISDQDAVTKLNPDALAKLNHHAQVAIINGAGHAPFVTHVDDFSKTFA